MSTTRAETAATGVGLLTLAVGAALTGAPRTTGRAVGVPGGHDAGLRAVGVADLVIAVGLLAGRPRWPWLAARAAANPPTAYYLLSLARRHDARALRPIAAFIAVATVGDLDSCRVLHAADRNKRDGTVQPLITF